MAEWDLGTDGWRLIEFALRMRREASRCCACQTILG